MKKIIQTNKKAKFDYEFITNYEAGIVLTGNEIKSIRENKVNLKGSFCKFVKNELFIFEMFIGKYSQANSFYTIDEKRVRKLLLKRKELNKLAKEVELNGYSIIPITIYLLNNKCKLEIALAKGKKNYDKRKSLKEKDIKRDIDRNMKKF